MSKRIVSTELAPQAVGPYSQAVVADGYVFTSGQIPCYPQDGELLEGSVADQTRLVLDNLRAVLEAAGSGLDKVVKTTVFLIDMDSFSEMNRVFAEYFPEGSRPARSTVQVSRLPKGAAVEIEAIALA